VADGLGTPKALDADTSGKIRNFLVDLAGDPKKLADYINDPVSVLAGRSELTPVAKALLLDGNFARVHAVMSQSSTPVRWIVIWIV
jgi:hypothetical protein